MEAITMTVKTFDSEAFCGYKQITTFFEDFSIADNFGVKAIKSTYKRAFREWKHDYKYLTELVLVLNWKCWQHLKKNEAYSKLYADLYYEVHEYALDNLKGEELTYYLRITD